MAEPTKEVRKCLHCGKPLVGLFMESCADSKCKGYVPFVWGKCGICGALRLDCCC